MNKIIIIITTNAVAYIVTFYLIIYIRLHGRRDFLSHHYYDVKKHDFSLLLMWGERDFHTSRLPSVALDAHSFAMASRQTRPVFSSLLCAEKSGNTSSTTASFMYR